MEDSQRLGKGNKKVPNAERGWGRRYAFDKRIIQIVTLETPEAVICGSPDW